jgi:hypothetical protein
VSELDLLNLARSTTEHQVTWFAQMITINFGMVVAIYYFLHGAKLALKIFTFFAYTVGMMVLLGEMLVEANIKEGVIETLHALPTEHLSRPIVRFLSVYDSWLALTRRITFNLSILVVLVRNVLPAFFLETRLEAARFQIISRL